jgi:hypothetical protein
VLAPTLPTPPPPQRRAFGKQSMSQPTLRSCPVPPLVDYFQTRPPPRWKPSLPPSTDGLLLLNQNTTEQPILPSLQAVLPFSRIDASRSFQHPSADSSSAAHSSNACRRWYRLRYEIRLNPISILQRCHRTQEPKSTGNIAYIPSSPSPQTLCDSIASIPQQSCLHSNPQLLPSSRLETMPSRLNAPVLTVDVGLIHKVDTRNVENLFSMWTGECTSLEFRP